MTTFDTRQPVPPIDEIAYALGANKSRDLAGRIWGELKDTQWGVKNYPDYPCGRDLIITIPDEAPKGRYCIGSTDTSLTINPRHIVICPRIESCRAHRRNDGMCGDRLPWILKAKECPLKLEQMKMEGL